MMYEHTGDSRLQYRRAQMRDRQDLYATPPKVIDLKYRHPKYQLLRIC